MNPIPILSSTASATALIWYVLGVPGTSQIPASRNLDSLKAATRQDRRARCQESLLPNGIQISAILGETSGGEGQTDPSNVLMGLRFRGFIEKFIYCSWKRHSCSCQRDSCPSQEMHNSPHIARLLWSVCSAFLDYGLAMCA